MMKLVNVQGSGGGQFGEEGVSNQLPGGEIKRDPEIGKTAILPEPAQTANLSISVSRLISSITFQFVT